ncbi:MAG: peptidoglycan-associated lipoprotein Pal [Halomonadaceae bacterium]|nr:MAG: peptidoglycan-associated lipoprotein Pal [Halomonadaceae bacterium]
MNLRFLVMLLLLAFVAGCSTTDTQDDAGLTDEEAAAQAEERAARSRAFGAGSGDGISDEDLSQEERAARDARRAAEEGEDLRQERVIYFDFDSAEIKRESRAVLEAHAAYLNSNGNASVTLQGHTDERGTKEYNLALGERRAEAVKQFLVVNDVRRGQIETVSYGEERPVNESSSEEAYSENRRVEIDYN